MADYYDSISRLDTLVGHVLAALERTGKAGTTFVLYIGDHGSDMLRGKRTSYEGGVRIPLLVRWPGGAQTGQVRRELVSTVDFMPTVLELAGAAVPSGLAGRSLVPVLRAPGAPWREHLFTEFHTHAAQANFWPQRTVRDDRHKLIENLLPGEVNPGYEFTLHHLEADLAAAIAAAPEPVRTAYARMEKPPRWELYDLQADPHEFRDLAADPAHAATLARLQGALGRWREETSDPLLKPSNLARLKAEISAVRKQEAREQSWDYPYYFFGQEPPARVEGAATPARKRKKEK